ncbi:hypothetical protein SAMN05216287_4328 [Pseudomonas kuykendallii]|uniref:Uncharacterized protein n=1 Tax=Pseudomonas kuykendallii TaxID=1007099 RepID=A0A1H3GE40_9PSED|nr:hypothetical protein SAMN05216287_4328 [Pseudomonas kuykendallii]
MEFNAGLIPAANASGLVPAIGMKGRRNAGHPPPDASFGWPGSAKG